MAGLAATMGQSHRSEHDAEGRIPYAVTGVVTTVKDPDGLGRVKARWAGMEDGVESHWLAPLWPGYIESAPAVREPVIIFFVNGDTSDGHYAVFPASTTKNRPTEAMILGTTFLGLYNDLVAKFNNLKSAFNSFVTTYNTHMHVVAGVQLGAGSVTSVVPVGQGTSDADADAAKGKNASGAVVAAIATDQVVLSPNAKVK